MSNLPFAVTDHALHKFRHLLRSSWNLITLNQMPPNTLEHCRVRSVGHFTCPVKSEPSRVEYKSHMYADIIIHSIYTID